MTMELLAEWTREHVLLRMLACDCPAEGGCETRILAASVPGAHEALWLSMVIGPASEIHEGVVVLLEPDDEWRARLERGLALVGLSWEQVSFSRDVALAQAAAYSLLPEWMQELPRGLLWATRGCVFGPDLTRVPRALWASHKAFVADTDEPVASFAQDWPWGQCLPEWPALEPWTYGH